MEHNTFSDITPEILRLAKKSEEAGIIDSELYTRYDVKRGLRDINGKGVLAGLTHISDVRATEIKDGVSVPAHGKLFYRGYNVQDLINGFTRMTVSVLKKPLIFYCSESFPTAQSLRNSGSFSAATVPCPPAL